MSTFPGEAVTGLSTTNPPTPEPRRPSRRRPPRPWRPDLLVLGTTVLATGATWTVLTQLLGLDLEAPMNGEVAEVGPVPVLLSTALIGFLGLVVLRLLERTVLSARSALWAWTGSAVVALALSFGGPATATTTTGVVGLSLLHVVVALVLVPGTHVVRRDR